MAIDVLTIAGNRNASVEAQNADKSVRDGSASEKADALLVIDMINAFDFEGGDRLGKRAVSILGPLCRLRDRFDAAGLPVIYVNDNFMHWQADFRDLIATCAQRNAHGARIVSRLAPQPGHYHVLKPRHSGFMDTPLEILLEKLGARCLALTGIATDSCVAATAHDAKMRDIRIWVPADCTEALSPSRKRLALRWLETALDADVSSSRSSARNAALAASDDAWPLEGRRFGHSRRGEKGSG